MPLVQSALSALLLDVLKQQGEDKQTPSASPVPTAPALAALAGAYHKWVMTGFPLPPLAWTVPPTQAALQGLLSAPMFSGWGPGLMAYWSPTSINGPGFMPINPLSPPAVARLPVAAAQVVSELALQLVSSAQLKNETVEAVADKLAAKLFTFTTGLSYMTTTTTLPPASAIVPVL